MGSDPPLLSTIARLLVDNMLKIRCCRPMLAARDCISELMESATCEMPVSDPMATMLAQYIVAANTALQHVCVENVQGYTAVILISGGGSGTIRILLLFPGLRRFAYLVRGVQATGRS